MRTRYPSARRRARSGLRLNSSSDIEDTPLFFNFNGAAFAKFTGVGERGGIAVRHRELDVGFWRRVRMRQLHDLFEGNVLVRHRLFDSVDDDHVTLGRPQGHDEPFNTWCIEIDPVVRLNETILTTADLQENCFLGRRVSEVIQNAARQLRTAPGHLALVQGELEVAVGFERDEAFGTLSAQVYRLVEADVFEVAGRQQRKQEVVVATVEPGTIENLPSCRYRFRHVDVAEGEVIQREADAVSGGLP